MTFQQIKTLTKAKKFVKALSRLEKFLKHHRECPQLWNLRGDLIQLLDVRDGPPLAEAARSYKTALRINPGNLEALESLAHFYDAVDSKPAAAKRYAKAYLLIAKRGVCEMERIIVEET